MFNALQAIQAGQAGTQAREKRERKNAFAQAGDAYMSGDYKSAAGALMPHDMGAGIQMAQYGQQQAQTAETERLRKVYEVTQLLAKEPDVMRRVQMAQQMSPGLGIPAPTDPSDYTDEVLQRELDEMRIKGGFEAEAPEAYTLAPGAVRYEGNQIVASNPKVQDDGLPWYITDQGVDPRYVEAQNAKKPSTQLTVKTGNEADMRPVVDKPAKGFQRIWDEEGGTYRDVPIPGSSVAREEESANIKAMSSLESSRIQFDTMINNINEARDALGYGSAGVMGLTAGLPMTPARTLKNRLDTVMANIGFDKLQEMRENSPTGGALGQVSEREIDFLQATRGKIDQLTDPEQIAQVLDEIEASLRRLQEVRELSWHLEQGSTEGGQARPQVRASGDVPPPPPGFEVMQ